MERPIITRVDARAARYLQLLVEFGHLDAPNAERVLLTAVETWPGSDHGDKVPLSIVRRVAATFLAPTDGPAPFGAPTEDMLAADWPLLFY